ncbi:DUF3488 and transglutaminase-like domain-containing protein [Aliiglaciecola sp. LCG003]|uniref:transglutaminase family protein n=1 Tax=Aliiglaciecola sp. LCG003 TaxID=3053655 RepID=UPI002573AA64|nr:DUF3488 and transglutaminase-like domain-containing protein [Aliiglaciecola sp. LCG003]WJG08239.1 DUF3488 and transglutaminase-like domain-containing protein [Aliiglaciecola sp. LCG003]
MSQSLNNVAHLLITVVFIAVSFSLAEPVMGWIFVLVICAGVMRLALFLGLHKHSPSVRTLNLLALLSGIVLAYFSFQLGILLAMLNLLVMACALKLMLLKTDKDYYQLVTTCGFLLGCGFIFQQGIGFSLLYLALTLLLLLSLASNISPALSFKHTVKRVSILVAQSVPLTLLMFLVLPQLQPLWQMPSSKQHKTGLAEKVTPGDIAKLSQSAELAFRVEFDGAVPAIQQRYWRAIVMEYFDGKSWQVSPDRRAVSRQYRAYNREFKPQLEGQYFSYQIIAEPTHQRWLYGLDIAQPDGLSSDRKIWQGQDYQLVSETPLVSSYQYRLRSYPQAPLNQTIFSLDKRINLQLPEQGNPRTQLWVSDLRRQYPLDADFIQAVQHFFATQPFEYTLQPPLMQNSPVDTFLFDKQQGFCSHYASAMAYILRLGGIPARMVTGYQGGEMRQSNFLSVYQYDAHAWVEAWHSDLGWLRYDPTAIIAPNRINFGLRAAVENANELIDSAFSLNRFNTIGWLKELGLLLGDIDFLWSKWVLGFDQNKQQDLIKSIIGDLTPKKLALFGLGVVAIIALLLVLFFLPKWRHPKADEAMRYYQHALTLLGNHHMHRLESDGPNAFAKQVEAQAPRDVSRAFNKITDLIIQHRYQPSTDKGRRVAVLRLKQHWIDLKKALKQHSKNSR